MGAKKAARAGDKVKQDGPHCHMLHPPPPPGVPKPHGAKALKIVPPCSPNVKFDNKAAARVSDKSAPCMLSGCAPGGPGLIAKGSMTVKINMLSAARKGDATAHAGCVAPIPALTGKVVGKCSPTVKIGD